jgi:hypothetical protein
MRKSGSFLVFIVSLISFFLLCPSSSYGASTIKVGIVDTYTGPATTFTLDVLDGFKKAGKADIEKFITALEGMTLDSPVGKLEIRACDHQLQLPTYWGVTKKDPKYPDFLVAGDIQIISPRDYMPTCAEIMDKRKK